ncbi:MAG: carbon-nitrogen hydrolase family protein [Magnetococcus sp. WYHC-3]
MSSPALMAVVQMCSGPDRRANLESASTLLEQAAALGARLAVLPENFSFMGQAEGEVVAMGETPEDSVALAFLRERARHLGMWIVGGSLPLVAPEHPGKVTNTCFVVHDGGDVVARYDKIHLFDVALGAREPYRESRSIAPGREPVVVDTPWGRMGLTICYDLRFGELFRELARRGAEIFTVPAAFTLTTGKDHWEVLLRARAIEHFAHVLAAGQGGVHPGGRRTYGHSLMVEPWGLVTGRAPDGPGVAVALLDPGAPARRRREIPCHQHRVLERP